MSKKTNNPGKGDKQAPATQDQIDFLRRYSNLEIEELAKLGKAEAAELIDELEAAQQRAADKAVPRGCGVGCFKMVIIVVLLIAIAGALWLLDHRKKALATEEAKAPGEEVVRVEKPAPKPATPGGDGGSTEGRSREPVAPVAPPPPPVWPPSKYPAVCRALKPVVLLAEDGSKVEIGEGESFHVLASPRPNIWRFQYKGKVLIGSGSRIEGKLGAVEK